MTSHLPHFVAMIRFLLSFLVLILAIAICVAFVAAPWKSFFILGAVMFSIALVVGVFNPSEIPAKPPVESDEHAHE